MSDVQHKQLRPGNRIAKGDKLKLHLRLLRLNGKTWRVLTLRPGTDAAFSTNYFHDTWHFISDKPGAELLGRIFWGLSYQREPNTIFLLHGEHLKPTPFEAEPSLPFVILPASISAPDPQAFEELRKLLPRLPNPTMTVRLQTWGLDEALNAEDPDWTKYGMPHWNALGDLQCKERATLCGGLITYCAPPAILRQQGVCVHSMDYWFGVTPEHGMDYHELSEHTDTRHYQVLGEVQIFRRYHEMLSESAEARRSIAQDNSGTLPDIPTDSLRLAIWEKTERIAARRLKAKRQPA